MREILNFIRKELRNFYSEGEIESIIRLIFEIKFNFSSLDIHLKVDFPADNFFIIEKIISELKNQKPIQYILGETEFLGLKFFVNESVLIPRSETEELVDKIIKENRNSKLKILEIGTGSGCIAVSLKKFLRNCEVDAFDISNLAIEMAKKNAILNEVEINFFEQNIFSFDSEKKYDLIVSNPPYVCDSEKFLMNANVLNFEPPIAIFVPDDSSLIFYEKIAFLGKKNLARNGRIYLEINENLFEETKNVFAKNGYQKIEIFRDIHEKNRMLRAVLE